MLAVPVDHVYQGRLVAEHARLFHGEWRVEAAVCVASGADFGAYSKSNRSN